MTVLELTSRLNELGSSPTCPMPRTMMQALVEEVESAYTTLTAERDAALRLVEQWRGSADCCINRAEAYRPWGDEDLSRAAVYRRCADELAEALAATKETK